MARGPFTRFAALEGGGADPPPGAPYVDKLKKVPGSVCCGTVSQAWVCHGFKNETPHTRERRKMSFGDFQSTEKGRKSMQCTCKITFRECNGTNTFKVRATSLRILFREGPIETLCKNAPDVGPKALSMCSAVAFSNQLFIPLSFSLTHSPSKPLAIRTITE